jgi:hypothetical protein
MVAGRDTLGLVVDLFRLQLVRPLSNLERSILPFAIPPVPAAAFTEVESESNFDFP